MEMFLLVSLSICGMIDFIFIQDASIFLTAGGGCGGGGEKRGGAFCERVSHSHREAFSIREYIIYV